MDRRLEIELHLREHVTANNGKFQVKKYLLFSKSLAVATVGDQAL